MYANGIGVPKDYVAAYMWWNLAAARGNDSSAKARDDLVKVMTPSQIKQARALSAAWKVTASRITDWAAVVHL